MLGIVAVVAAFIPVLSYIAWAIGIAAVVVGIVALAGHRLTKRGGAVAGIILGAVAVVLSIVLSIIYTSLFFLSVGASALASAHPSTFTSSDTSASSGSAPSSSSDAQTSPKPAHDTVTYRVTGPGKAVSITYLTADSSGGDTNEVSSKNLPWKKTVTIDDSGLFSTTVFSLVAQKGAGAGTITCEIEANGKVISKHSSSGDYSAVSCSGSAG